MRIARQGFKFIFGATLLVALGVWIARYQDFSVFGEVLVGLGALFAFFCVYFFRDPDRLTPNNPLKIYAPGDGTVLSVAREGSGESTTIRIFLSLLNVHVQRAPCSGRVMKIQYTRGSFKAAMLASALSNEKCALTLEHDGSSHQITVDQIAGLLARRISWRVKEGDHLKAGERYGLISFGSQVAVHFPDSAKSIVKPGDKVFAGVTPIAEWTN
jgi:phosphatidylserine decarboxylase